LGSPFAYRYRGTQNGWELLFHPPYSPDLAPSDYHLFGPLKDYLRSHHYETDEAVQEAVRSWLRGARTDFYRRDIEDSVTVLEMHRSGWGFCGKVIKDV
jgi:transposase